ncbi:MAG: hypothetical protein WC554_11520 [Clostridia bacterium]|jgi:hypothetical protein
MNDNAEECQNLKNTLDELTQYRLKCILTEYKALRDEIIKCSDRQLSLFYYLVLILTAFYGIMGTAYVSGHDLFFLLILIPFYASPFILRYSWEQYNTAVIGKYISDEIEGRRIPDLLGERSSVNKKRFDKYWIGWQHYWDDVGWQPNIVFSVYKKHTAVLILLFISFSPAMIYPFYYIGLNFHQLISQGIGGYLIILGNIGIFAALCILLWIIYSSISKYEKMSANLKSRENDSQFFPDDSNNEKPGIP